MDVSLIQTTLAIGSEDDVVWVQLLVLAIIVVLFAVGGLNKTKAKKLKGKFRSWVAQFRMGAHNIKPRATAKLPVSAIRKDSFMNKSKRIVGKTLKDLKDKGLGIIMEKTQRKAVAKNPVDLSRPKSMQLANSNRDLHSGMELLESDFLLRVVETNKEKDEADIHIRKLCFTELLRRNELGKADSAAVKIYAINQDNRYGKKIQCGAMKELSGRTLHKVSI
jgi:hypothetical protein